MTSHHSGRSIFKHRRSFATALRGFGPLGIFAILVILAGNFLVVPLSAVLVLVRARLSRTPWRFFPLTSWKCLQNPRHDRIFDVEN